MLTLAGKHLVTIVTFCFVKMAEVLEKQAREIRQANMKEFESILTRQQKKTLKQMKKEGRKRYYQGHPCMKPPMPQVKK